MKQAYVEKIENGFLITIPGRYEDYGEGLPERKKFVDNPVDLGLVLAEALN